jgi:hypothetical protein
LRDIVLSGLDDLQQAFEESVRTGGRTIIPAGRYKCLIASGKLDQARTGTACYTVVFEVVEGPHSGRKFYYPIWLTPKALRMSGHELARLGFRSISELEERPLPTGLMAVVQVVINTDDDDSERNKVRSFKVIDGDVPPADFRPAGLDVERAEGDGGPLDAAGPVSTPRPAAREPGKDDDLDEGDDTDAQGFDWRRGELRHTSSAPLLDAAQNGKERT